MRNVKDMSILNPYAIIVKTADRGFMLFHRQVRRAAHFVVALLPLMMLLVGSCKTSQLPWSYGSNAGPEQFRTALFPDRVNYQGAHYYPAAGYISRAQSFVAGTPDNLMLLTQQEIGYLFGKPSLHRQDADAEVWQYKTRSCVVDFYFYDTDRKQGQSPLVYADMRLKEEMVPGSLPRKTPLSEQEKSDCLHDVVSGGFQSMKA